MTHTRKQLEDLTLAARQKLRLNGTIVKTWRHKKQQTHYRVVEPVVVLRECDVVPVVLYQESEVYGGMVWSRPVDEFVDRFEPIRKVERWEVIE